MLPIRYIPEFFRHCIFAACTILLFYQNIFKTVECDNVKFIFDLSTNVAVNEQKTISNNKPVLHVSDYYNVLPEQIAFQTISSLLEDSDKYQKRTKIYFRPFT